MQRNKVGSKICCPFCRQNNLMIFTENAIARKYIKDNIWLYTKVKNKKVLSWLYYGDNMVLVQCSGQELQSVKRDPDNAGLCLHTDERTGHSMPFAHNIKLRDYICGISKRN